MVQDDGKITKTKNEEYKRVIEAKTTTRTMDFSNKNQPHKRVIIQKKKKTLTKLEEASAWLLSHDEENIQVYQDKLKELQGSIPLNEVPSAEPQENGPNIEEID